MSALGFANNAAGTLVVYDMEGYSNTATCKAAVKEFMQGWVDQLAVARPPKFVWAANWDNNPSTSTLSCASGTSWASHQRLKQYQGDHNETYGGVTINIDSNCANGPLAPTGGGVKTADGVHVDTLCGRATVMRFERVQSEANARAVAMKAGGAVSQLGGSISAPDEASRGGLLRYTVTLNNPTASPVSLAACPSYTQSVWAEGKSSDTTQRLNCAAAGGQIPANGRVSFDMQVAVPAELAAGNGKLS